MELKYKVNMKKYLMLILMLCFFTYCSKESFSIDPETYDYYYPTDDKAITADNISGSDGAFDPKAIAISKEKLYVCNGNVLEIFDALTLAHLKTVSNYTKNNTTIALTNLTSVCIDNGRIYLGSTDSRLFVFDETTLSGISTVGNGQWWQTFVHVFGVTVKDGLVFVKEKNTTIKVFETAQITETSDWNLAPIAKLNTLNGYTEIYSLDVLSGNLVVAGRDAKSYLYYDIANIKANSTNSLTTPIEPEKAPFTDRKPIAVTYSKDWAITSENVGNAFYLRIYTNQEFNKKSYEPIVNVSDIMGQNPFGSIVSTAILNDRIFLSDNSNKKIRVLKLNKSTIAEQYN